MTGRCSRVVPTLSIQQIATVFQLSIPSPPFPFPPAGQRPAARSQRSGCRIRSKAGHVARRLSARRQSIAGQRVRPTDCSRRRRSVGRPNSPEQIMPSNLARDKKTRQVCIDRMIRAAGHRCAARSRWSLGAAACRQIGRPTRPKKAFCRSSTDLTQALRIYTM